MAALTQSQRDLLQHAIDTMTRHPAHEIPFHTDQMFEVAQVAVGCGYFPNTGSFMEAAKDQPISTLLGFARFLGWDIPGQADVAYTPVIAHVFTVLVKVTPPFSGTSVALYQTVSNVTTLLQTFSIPLGDAAATTTLSYPVLTGAGTYFFTAYVAGAGGTSVISNTLLVVA